MLGIGIRDEPYGTVSDGVSKRIYESVHTIPANSVLSITVNVSRRRGAFTWEDLPQSTFLSAAGTRLVDAKDDVFIVPFLSMEEDSIEEDRILHLSCRSQP